jgi:hypothetical protein
MRERDRTAMRRPISSTRNPEEGMMRNLVLSFLVLAASLCTGCASGLVGTLPDVKDPNTAAEIWIIRSYNYVSSGVSAYVAFDDNDVLAIRTVEHAKFLAPSGNHTIGVRNPGFPNNNIPVLLLPKSKYYFAVSVGFTNFSLVQMEESEALPYITSTHFVPLEKK